MSGSIAIESIFIILWGGVLLLWLANTYLKNSEHANSLHRIMSFCLGFKFLQNLSWVWLLLLQGQNEYLAFALTTSYTWYNTLKYVSLILISKGFNITRSSLERNEVTILALLMGLIYLSFCAYNIERVRVVVLIISLLFGLSYFIYRFTLQNIYLLKQRYQRLEVTQNSQVLLVTLDKLRMMKIFLWTIQIYFAQIFCSLILLSTFLKSVMTGYDDSNFKLAQELFDQSSEFCCICLIFYVFRARKRRRFFRMSEIGFLEYHAVPFYRATRKTENEEPIAIMQSAGAVLVASKVELDKSICPSGLDEPLLHNYG